MRYWILFSFVLLNACGQNRAVKIKGSDTEVNLVVLLAEEFKNSKPDFSISISGGGSGMGIASLLNGTADIANSSRSMNEGEWALFRQKNIAIDSFVFAVDAIAFVVSKDIPIDSISTEDLAGILSGEKSNWSFLTGQDLPINIYGRQNNSGTHAFIKQKLQTDFSPHAKQMNGNAQILEAIKADHSGIGYVGAGYLGHGEADEIKAISIYTSENKKSVSPLDAESISRGGYFFQRPLFQYYRSDSYTRIRPFLDFENSPAGQKIIQASGYYPIN